MDKKLETYGWEETMKRRWGSLGLSTLLGLSSVVFAGPESAQQQKPVPMMGSEFRFMPGTWSLYTVTDTREQQTYTMRVSVLDSVSQRRATAYWLEIEILSSHHPDVVTRLLVPDTGQGPGDAQKAYVQVAGYPPFEVPRHQLRADRKKDNGQTGPFLTYELVRRPDEKTLAWKGRTIKATTVEAIDPHAQPATVVVSRDAPPLGIVELTTPEVRMELLNWGTGATTKITEKPTGLWRWMWNIISQTMNDAQQPASDEAEASPAQP